MWIYPNQNVTTANGFPMQMGESLTIGMQDKAPEIPGWELIEVWGITDAVSEMATLSERI